MGYVEHDLLNRSDLSPLPTLPPLTNPQLLTMAPLRHLFLSALLLLSRTSLTTASIPDFDDDDDDIEPPYYVSEGTSILVNEIQRQNNQSLLWGPYRPNLYLGIKPRLPESFIGGLMWSNVEDYQSLSDSEFSLSLSSGG